MKPDSSIGFGCAAATDGEALHAAGLVESLREFGGERADQPFWVLVPPAVMAQPRVPEQLARVGDAGALVVPLDTSAGPMELPFSTKTLGAAQAEKLAAGQVDLLAWMDAGSLVVREPRPLVLPRGKAFGYRPVDHTLIGSIHAAPPDAFWQHIYEGCAAPAGRMFPMPTTTDGHVLRPYFNAGLMVVPPERGIFGAWLANFARLHKQEVFAPSLTERLYRIFFHQAVLAGTVLNLVGPSEMVLLPPSASYPLHMHDQQPVASRATSVEQLTTLRHEGVFHRPAWSEQLDIAIGEELAAWVAARFPPIKGDSPPAAKPAPEKRA